MQMNTVQDLTTIGMSYVLDFEERIAELAPKMAEASSDQQLKELFGKTATKSKEYAQRVEAAFGKLGAPVEKNENHLAVAMVKEVEGMIGSSEAGPVRDAALILAANQQQGYRVTSYGSLETFGKLLGKQDAVSGITESLNDSKEGDKKFTALAESKVNQAALAA